MTYNCPYCAFSDTLEEATFRHIKYDHSIVSPVIYGNKSQEAKRDPVGYRFDILIPSFIEAMAKIADYGAKKYGDLNWQKSRLSGANGPPNHMLMHLNQYMCEEDYDHTEIGVGRKYHLAAVAFNAMMEWWYEENANSKESKM
jgi:hypothetical protein